MRRYQLDADRKLDRAINDLVKLRRAQGQLKEEGGRRKASRRRIKADRWRIKADRWRIKADRPTVFLPP
jgi:hypothetical protein